MTSCERVSGQITRRAACCAALHMHCALHSYASACFPTDENFGMLPTSALGSIGMCPRDQRKIASGQHSLLPSSHDGSRS